MALLDVKNLTKNFGGLTVLLVQTVLVKQHFSTF